MVICLDQGADLDMAQLMSLPLTASCFSKMQIGFNFLVPAYPGNPGQSPEGRKMDVCITRKCNYKMRLSVLTSGMLVVLDAIQLSRIMKNVSRF